VSQPRVFISYRADDSLGVASALARELERVFSKEAVFVDHRTLKTGEPWPDQLRNEVQTAAVVLVLIGPRWFTLQGAYGVRRLDQQDDWVRQEIEGALAARGTIVPVLVDGAPPLEREAFKTIPQIASIADLQALKLSTREWESSFDTLVQMLVERGFRRVAAIESAAPSLPSRVFPSTIPSRGQAPFVGRDDLIDQIRTGLGDPATQQFLVLHGPPGVGKSEIAREYARRYLQHYPGGSFFVSVREKGPPVELAELGRNVLGLSFPPDVSLHDQCMRTILNLRERLFILVYDNAGSPDSVESWLPPASAGGHVLVTSNWERWDARWQCLPVAPLTDVEAGRLVATMAGGAVTETEMRSAIRLAGGLPVQLVPAARALRRAAERHRKLSVPVTELATETRASFAAPWSLLTEHARLLLACALLFHPDRVDIAIMEQTFVEAGLSAADFAAALDLCSDLSMLTGGDPMRLHSLFARYVSENIGDLSPELLRSMRQVLSRRFHEAAEVVVGKPTDTQAVAALTTFSPDHSRWPIGPLGMGQAGDDVMTIGTALQEIGQFAEARGWYERAVTERERGDADGRVNHDSLGASLHLVGWCLSSTGRFDEARSSYERAVKEKRLGDLDGLVNHASVGTSLHQVGLCLSSTGRYSEARECYEQAVKEKEQGDAQGRVNPASVGTSLHQVGRCLSAMDRIAEARTWYEAAVRERRRGDADQQVDHASVAISLHEVGSCLSAAKEFQEAKDWYEKAVLEARQGDLHGRVDHESVGTSLHQVGSCLSSMGQFAEAQRWFEDAVKETELGDVYGRVDHTSLGISLHRVGKCLFALARFDEAQTWYARAAAEKQLGDTHGRVDHASLGASFHELGRCLFSSGDYAAARGWYERAVNEKTLGDLYGSVDAASVEASRAEFEEAGKRSSAPGGR
jgi:tetratricopeptide (TPR) repeat protein